MFGKGAADYRIDDSCLNFQFEKKGIIHFNSSVFVRPWFKNSNDPFRNVWLYYKEKADDYGFNHTISRRSVRKMEQREAVYYIFGQSISSLAQGLYRKANCYFTLLI